MAKRITKSQEIEIIRLYIEESKSSKEISEIIGVSSSSVLRVLKRNNVETRSKAPINTPNKFSKEKEQEIIKLYLKIQHLEQKIVQSNKEYIQKWQKR